MIKYDDGVELSGNGEQIFSEWLEVSARIAQQLSSGTGMDISNIAKNMSDVFLKAVDSLGEDGK